MKDPAIASYHDAVGDRHELVVRETADGRWLVLDLNGEGAHVIDELARDEDGRPQAEAIARHRRRSRARGGTGGRRAHT